MKSSLSSSLSHPLQSAQVQTESPLPVDRYQLGWMEANAITPPLERRLNRVQPYVDRLLSNRSLSLKLKALGAVLWLTVGILFSPWLDGLNWGYRYLIRWVLSLPAVGKKAKRRSLSRPRQLSSNSEANTRPEGEQILILVDADNFVFHFNNDGLVALQIARSQQKVLDIPAPLLAHLRYISFSQILPIPAPSRGSRVASKMVNDLFGSFCFCTCYHNTYHNTDYHDKAIAPRSPNSLPNQQRVIRTVLSIDGDILQQISHSSLSHPQCAQIIDAHHWLIQHLLERLQMHTTIYIDYAVLSLNFTGFAVYHLNQMPSIIQNPSIEVLQILVSLGVPYLIALIWELFRKKLLPSVTRRLTRWLWNQLFEPTPFIYQFAMTFLRLR